MQRYTKDDIEELYEIIDSEYQLLFKKTFLSNPDKLVLTSFSSVYRSLSIYKINNEYDGFNFNMYKHKPLFVFNNDFWKFCSPYNSLFTILPFTRGEFYPFSSYNYNKFNNSTQGTRKFMLKNNCILVVYLTEEYINSKYSYTINIFVNIKKLKELIIRPDYKLEVILNIVKTYKLNELENNLSGFISKLLNDNYITNNNISQLDLSQLPFQLYNYQKNNVDWMISIETSCNNIEYEVNHIHSLFPNNKDYDVYKTIIFNKNDVSNIIENKQLIFTGGVLMDEMGLGKTITCLSFLYFQKIKNNNCSNLNNLNTKYCNYKYKRGNFTNTFCDKKTVDNTLFCKTHKKTFPNVLRYDFSNNNSIAINLINNFIKTNTSLIVCPSHLCDQWMQEIISKFKGKLNAIMISTIDHLYNINTLDILMADILIVSSNFFKNTSYIKFCEKKKSINLSDSLKDENNSEIFPLHNFKWKRIILDEAHELLNDDIIFKYLYKLESDFKWILSGTPFANGIKDLYKILFWLTESNQIYNNRKIPFNLLANNYSYDTLNNYGLQSSSFLNSITRFFRRNLKHQVKLEIPTNIVNENIKYLNFTPHERNIYDSYINGQTANNLLNDTFLLQLCCDPELYEDTRELIQNCKSLQEVQNIILKYNQNKLEENKNQLNNCKIQLHQLDTQINDLEKENNNNNLDQIRQLKQAVGIQKRNIERIKKLVDSYQRTYNYLLRTMSEIETSITQNKQYNCPICLDDIENENLGMTQCGHQFCWDCIEELFINNNLDNKIKCPSCCMILKTSEIFKLQLSKESFNDTLELDKYIQDVKSTKIGNIIYFLKNELHNHDKCIIFSQWDTLLQKVKSKIDQFGIKSVNCIGTVYQKRKAISQFTNDNDTKLIFLSSQNSASGLNLICANKIIFIEPVYGSNIYKKDIENQAIGRADRIGQNLPIDIYRFIIKDTIEETISTD